MQTFRRCKGHDVKGDVKSGNGREKAQHNINNNNGAA